MKCFGEFREDRICELCEETNYSIFQGCEEKFIEARNLRRKLAKIKACCPHRTRCYDEYTPFDGCKKNGNGNGRFADFCVVKLDCAIKEGENNDGN